MNVVVAGIPAERRRIDPSLERKRERGRPRRVEVEFLGLRNVFGPAADDDRIVAVGQVKRFTVTAVDLLLEEEIGRKPFRGIRIDPVEAVANQKRRDRRPTVLVAEANRHSPRRQRGKENGDVVSESDVLRALTDVESDLRRSLTAVAAVDLENHIFDGKPGQPQRHGPFVVDRNIGPALADVAVGDFRFRLR